MPSTEYTLRDQERMSLARNYFAWQARMVKPHAGRRVLEVGCGLGNFTRHLADRELVVGIDVEEPLVDAWNQSFRGSGKAVAFAMSVTDAAFLDLKRYQPDTMVCLNVLEHVEDDRRALEHMHRVLPPGGRVVLIVPALESLYGPIDRNLGHYRRYSRERLHSLAVSLGFRAKTRYFNLLGCAGWWMNARIFRRTEQSESQVRLFDRLVPFLSRAERLVGPPLGQSIFAVLDKP